MSFRLLQTLLRLYGAGWALTFTLVLANAWVDVVTDDGAFGARFVWNAPGEGHVVSMLASINIVMGAFLYASARDPLRHATFIDFALIANTAHMLVMLVMAVGDPHHHVNLTGDVPLGLVVTAIPAAAWLSHRRRRPAAPGSTSTSTTFGEPHEPAVSSGL